VFEKLEQERLDCKRELARLAFQIRVLEPNRELAKRVAEVAEKQPFIYCVVPRWGEGNFNEQFERFSNEVREFRKSCEALLNDVTAKYHGKKRS
jgi:hypothetical protein